MLAHSLCRLPDCAGQSHTSLLCLKLFGINNEQQRDFKSMQYHIRNIKKYDFKKYNWQKAK